MATNKSLRNEKTYRTQALKTKMHEETNISNAFILLYFYSRWSGLLISESIFQYSQKDVESPASANYNEDLTLFITGGDWTVRFRLQMARSQTASGSFKQTSITY